MVLAVSITLFFVLIYSLVVFMLWMGLGQLREGSLKSSDNQVSVSVLIPFRDEEEHLSALIHDLKGQTYPEELVEFIFVNDHSRDGSGAVLNALKGTDARFHCLELPDDKSGKKEAISYAVDHSKNNWLIQTDADCRIGPNFIATHMTFQKKYNSDLVAGLVTTGNGRGNFLQQLERLDILSLVGTGAGSFYFNRPVMCNGANLAFSRELYRETRRFDPSKIVESGDDMFLMIGARKLGKKLSFMVNQDAMVETIPGDSFRKIIAQRVRWASKAGHYKMIDIQLLALLVALTNLLVLFSPLLILLIPVSWIWLMSAFILKTLSDFNLLLRIATYTGQRKSLWLFLPISLIYYLLQIFILIGTLLFRTKWKGRIL
ncbi:MAG: hypothetical protein DRI70_10010 [Bacteroidetes bacterium]|nr:MAG: hypothetical protein DRI70_10010 [Bacteroidota bacterium]